MPREDLPSPVIDFYLPFALPACPFETQVHAADAGEEGPEGRHSRGLRVMGRKLGEGRGHLCPALRQVLDRPQRVGNAPLHPWTRAGVLLAVDRNARRLAVEDALR